MKCRVCLFNGKEKHFTTGNRSMNNTVGRCYRCQRILDAENREKTDIKNKTLELFELSPDLLNRTSARIGVLHLHKITDRNISKKGDYLASSFGLKAILKELDEPYETCYPETINNYKFILISLMSVMDVENLIYTFEKYCPKDIGPQIIVGGFGVVNIKLITKYIDVAVFGRAEGQINDIISGLTFKNIWRKTDDHDLDKRYQIRQPLYLMPGEQSVGCRNKCFYCQYTHIRQSIGKPAKYNPGMTTQETDWHGLDINKAGRYVTALDGFSEATRFRVNKKISDKHVIDKLLATNELDIDGCITLKLYQIVGYPFETVDSVMQDIKRFAELLKSIDGKLKHRINIACLVTPFGAEPLTPMENEPVDIKTNWNELLAGFKIYYGDKIKCYITTSVQGPFSIVKRMMIHRAEQKDLDMFKNIVFNKRLKRLPERFKVPFLLKHGYINQNIFGLIDDAPFDYLYI